MALAAHKARLYAGIQGSGPPAIIGEISIVSAISREGNVMNNVSDTAQSIISSIRRSPRSSTHNGSTRIVPCIVITRHQGEFRWKRTVMTITPMARGHVKLMSGDEQGKMFSFMYPSAVDARPKSKIVWAKQQYVDVEFPAYVTYSQTLKCFVCMSSTIMRRRDTITAPGALLLQRLGAKVHDGSHFAFKVKLKTRGDEKIVKSPVKLTKKNAAFVLPQSMNSMFS